MTVYYGQGLEDTGTPPPKEKGKFFRVCVMEEFLFSDSDDAYTNPYIW